MTQRRLRPPQAPSLIVFAVATMMSGVFFNDAAVAKDDARAAALRAAELARFQANDSADAKVLGELLDDALEYAHSNGELDSKQAFIASLVSGKRDYVSSVPTIESIRLFGDVAVIRGKAKVTVVDEGQSKDLHIGYTDVWVAQGGKWRMTAWRSTRLPASPVK
jgi:hypothetical protein